MIGTRLKDMFPALRAALTARLSATQLAGLGQAGATEDSRSAHARGNYELLRFLADQGDPGAQNQLGGMYAKGRGVRRDHAEAVKWWQRAAEQGHASAQFSLGSMYEKGTCVARDFVQAHKWYALAALRFPSTDAVNAAIASEFGKSLAAKMPPESIAEAQRLAAEWKPTMEAGARPRSR